MIGVLGDIHGDFKGLKRAHDKCVEKGAAALIQVGDFGFREGASNSLMRYEFKIPIYVIDGNHDDFSVIPGSDGGGTLLYAYDVYYVKRGSLLTIDGRRIAFLGGAGSIDKNIRLRLGWLWQPDEQISDDDLARTCALSSPIDLMITHCPPQWMITKYFETPEGIKFKTEAFGVAPDWSDPSASKVEKAWLALGMPPLVCGHMHRSVTDGQVRILNIDELIFV